MPSRVEMDSSDIQVVELNVTGSVEEPDAELLNHLPAILMGMTEEVSLELSLVGLEGSWQTRHPVLGVVSREDVRGWAVRHQDVRIG